MNKLWRASLILAMVLGVFFTSASWGQEKASVVKSYGEVVVTGEDGKTAVKSFEIKNDTKVPINLRAIVFEFDRSIEYTGASTSKPKLPAGKLTAEENAKYKLADFYPKSNVYRIPLEKPLKYETPYAVSIAGNAEGKLSLIVPFNLKFTTEPKPSE